MKVKEVMHKGVDWVVPDTPVTDIAKLMCQHDIGAIPIAENDRLIGMVTDRDIVCKGLAEDGFDASLATARDVMTPGIHCCREDDELAKAVRSGWSASSVWATSAVRHRVICFPNRQERFGSPPLRSRASRMMRADMPVAITRPQYGDVG